MSKYTSTQYSIGLSRCWTLVVICCMSSQVRPLSTLKCYEYNFSLLRKVPMCISTFMNVLSQNSPSYLLKAEKTSSDQYLQFNSRQQRYPSQSPVRPSFQPQHPRQRYMGGPSPINIHSLKNCLVGYPSKYIATSLLNGIQKGFCLNFADLGIPLIQKKKTY